MTSLASLDQDLPRLVSGALQLNKMAVGRLISLFEDDRTGSASVRSKALELIQAEPSRKNGRILGLTGTPGSGKSS
ncbi:MAG: hypothetical protein WD029_06290, partial [Microthrixaceae bacterium]